MSVRVLNLLPWNGDLWVPIRRLQSLSPDLTSFILNILFFSKKKKEEMRSLSICPPSSSPENEAESTHPLESILLFSRSMGASFQYIAQRSKVLIVYSSGPTHSFWRWCCNNHVLLQMFFFFDNILQMVEIGEYYRMSLCGIAVLFLSLTCFCASSRTRFDPLHLCVDELSPFLL